MKKFLLLFAAVLFLAALLALPSSAYTADGKITVLLDPGHSDNDITGGTWAGSRHESYYNMKVALACKEALEKTGKFAVYLSHPDNTVPATLLERTIAADSVNADLMFSIHFDGFEGTTERYGTEALVSVLPEYDMTELGELVVGELHARVGLAFNGFYQRKDTGDGVHVYYWDEKRQWDVPDDKSVGPVSDYYGVLTWGAKFGIPSIIIEHGFLTDERDRAIAENDDNLRLMGEADAAAIITYYTNHTHTWTKTKETDYPSNCCLTGKESYHCTICGARKNVTKLPPAPDNHYYYISEKKDAGCFEEGYIVYTCRYCQNLVEKGYPGYTEDTHSYVRQLGMLGHNYVVTKDVPLTHTQDGIHEEICSRCGKKILETERAEGHTFEFSSHTDPTCEEDGSDVLICPKCGETQTTTIPATGHHFEVTEDTDPTCIAAGVHTETCSSCGKEEKTVFPPIGHVWEDTGDRAPTCAEDGFHERTCHTCGETETAVLPMTGHHWDGGTVTRKATFFSGGERVYTCLHDPAHTYTEPILSGMEVFGVRRFAYLCSGGFLFLSAAVLTLILIKKKKKEITSEKDV